MKKLAKIWIIIALIFIVSGGAIFATGILIDGGLPMAKYRTETYTDLEQFSDIDINVSTTYINFIKSTDGKVKITCFEEEKAPHKVSVIDGKLSIEVQNNKKWYDNISFGFKKAKITLALPDSEYGALFVKMSTGDVVINNNLSFESIDIKGSTGNVECYANSNTDIKIDLSTGDIKLEQITAKNLALSVSTGEIEVNNAEIENDIKIKFSTDDVELENVSGTNLTIDGGTGDISLNNAIFFGKINISNSTGDVNFNRCDAGEIKVAVSTGDVKGSLLSSKIFIVDTDTGRKQVPHSTEGGICEITTSTGDIKITIAP